MPTRSFAVLAAASLFALPACSHGDLDLAEPGDPMAAAGIGAATSALGLYIPNPQGNLSIVTPPESAWVPKRDPGAWRTIDALSGLAHAHQGDSLEISVSAELETPNSDVFFRALVDGKVAAPTDTLFEPTDAGTWDGVRSFRFVQTDLKEGPHVVEVQWLGGGDGPRIRDRTLSLNTASPISGEARLVVVAGKSGPSIPVEETLWTDIPDLTGQIESVAKGDLRIAFSAEAEAATGTLLVRAVVDSQPTEPVRFTSDAAGLEMSSRSFVFRAPDVPIGWHDVRMQFAVASGNHKAFLGDRTMTLYAAPFSGPGGGMSTAEGSASAPVTPTEKWQPLPDTTTQFETVDPSSVTELAVSMEAKAAPGRLFTRVLVDGQPVQPGDVTMVQNVDAWGAYEFTFQLKNVPTGKHIAVIETMTDPGTNATIGLRTLTATTKRRDGADFAQPFRGHIRTMQPREIVYEHIVICFNPMRWSDTYGATPSPDYAELANTFLGWDNGPSVAGWLMENSDMRVRPGGHHFLGCYNAPEDHQGEWYWNNQAWDLMHFEALLEADKWFDFHPFDKNGDGHLTRDEAIVSIVKPQWGDADGQADHAQPVFTNDGAPITIHYTDIYWTVRPTMPYRRTRNVGATVHELSHELLGARDADEAGFNLLDLTVMGWWSTATHIDPAHKLFSGHVLPQVVEIGAWSTNDVQLAAIANHQDLLVVYDNSKVDEYFLIENRWPDQSSYDRMLGTAQSNHGVIVWRVVRDWSAGWWGQGLNRPIGILRNAGEEVELEWNDGSKANITVQALETSPKEHMMVKLIK
jgi:hypothetical protein